MLKLGLKSLLWSASLVAGCEMTRPYGAYRPPEEVDAGPEGFDEEPGGSEGGSSDAGVTIPRKDGGPRVGADGSTAPGRTPPAVPDSPLAPYAGTYLMRMDMFSSMRTSVPLLGRLEVNNRISNLLLAEVSVDGDHLVSHETLCHQTYEHDCASGCTGPWETKPDTELPKFFPRASTSRIYRVADGELTAERSVIALGFDDPSPSAESRLPTSLSDPSLWQLDPSEPSRVGLRTLLQAQFSVAGIDTRLNCVVSAVQLFASEFQGAIGEEGAPLEGVSFALTTPPMPGAPLDARGEPAVLCSLEALREQEATPAFGEQYVRFRKTDHPPDTCPTREVFDAELPAEAP